MKLIYCSGSKDKLEEGWNKEPNLVDWDQEDAQILLQVYGHLGLKLSSNRKINGFFINQTLVNMHEVSTQVISDPSLLTKLIKFNQELWEGTVSLQNKDQTLNKDITSVLSKNTKATLDATQGMIFFCGQW